MHGHATGGHALKCPEQLVLACSGASVDAVTALTVVCLARNRFVELLGPMEQIMQREKSDQVTALTESSIHHVNHDILYPVHNPTACMCRLTQLFSKGGNLGEPDFSGIHEGHGLLLCVQVVTQRLMKLATKGTPVHLPAEVIIRRRKRVRNSNGPSTDTWEMVRARGHLDEVEQLKSSAAPPSSARSSQPVHLTAVDQNMPRLFSAIGGFL